MDESLPEALSMLERAARRVREALGPRDGDFEDGDVRAARQMLSVLRDVERRGGRVSREGLLEIGESYGYRRQGMAGFYQQLVHLEGDDAVLTDAGRRRLRALADDHEPLVPNRIGPIGPVEGDAFLEHARAVRAGSGRSYDAEDAKRELYGR